MIGKALSNLLGKKALAWVGAGILSAAAIPAVGAASSRLAHRKLGVTHRTVAATMHHRAASKLGTVKKSPLHAAHKKAVALKTRTGKATPLAAVRSMHSGHATAGKLTTGKHALHATAKKLTTTRHRATNKLVAR